MTETLAQSFVRYVHEDLLQIKQPHFDIAFRLCEAKRLGYAEELGFANIYELSEKEFGFKRSSTAAYVAVAERFMSGMQLQERFDNFSFSQLVEMLPLSSYDASRISSDMTVKQIRQWRKDHKFVELADGSYGMYGSLSEKQKLAYDDLQEKKKQERKQQREDRFVQTSGQIENVSEDLQDFEKDVVVEPQKEVVKSNRLGLKNKAEREAWLENYKDWGVWLSVPELNLTCYKYKFANGHEVVVSESSCFCENYIGGKRGCLLRYHVINDKITFFDLSGVAETYVLDYMTEYAKEI